MGIQVSKPVDDEGEIRNIPLVQTKASDALLGPPAAEMPHPIRESCCKQLWFNLSISGGLRFWFTLWTVQQDMGSSSSSSLATLSLKLWGGSPFRMVGQARDVARRIRMGPRAREGSTVWPFCVISWVPAVTSLRAAERAGSRRSRQFSGSTDFAASLGQMLLEPSRLSRSCLMASSSCWSTGRTFCRRQRSEHHFTWCQFLAHFFRH